MCLSKPKAPKIAPMKPAPPAPSGEVIDSDVITERDRERRRLRGMSGRQSTILASRAQTYVAPTGQTKTALGS